jgi:Fur family peroxide stress response transcriptional regulator
VNTPQRYETLLARLKERGHRLTPQRAAILRALLEHPGHPSVEELHRQLLREFPSMSLATVYKTIAFLKDQGEVLELGFGEAGCRYDGRRPQAHPHLVCTRCGAIMDSPEGEDQALRTIIEQLADRAGFSLSHHRLDLFGLCPDCRKKA